MASPAESPEDRAARERRELAASKKGAYAAQTARVLSEVAESRRSFDRRMRGIGAVFTVLGLAHALESASSLAAGDEIYTFRFGGVPLVLGPLLLAAGAAGASDRSSVPVWYSVAVRSRRSLFGLGLAAPFSRRQSSSMTRPRWRMLGFVLVLLIPLVLDRVWPLAVPLAAALMVLAALSSLLLGRSFYRGRAAMRAGRCDEAIGHFEAFRSARSTSALPFLWLSLYTSDATALALNNIGACHLCAQRADRALAPLEEALARDPAYAMPHVNLACAHRLLGDVERSRFHADEARRLGFGRDAVEAAIRRAMAATKTRVGAGLG